VILLACLILVVVLVSTAVGVWLSRRWKMAKDIADLFNYERDMK
jgi:hypothetical protein